MLVVPHEQAEHCTTDGEASILFFPCGLKTMEIVEEIVFREAMDEALSVVLTWTNAHVSLWFLLLDVKFTHWSNTKHDRGMGV